MTYSMSNTSSTGMCPRLPLHQRHSPLTYTNDDGSTGTTAYPINYDELYNLKGRLLTLIDATYTDPEQRKAQKDLVWQALKSWMDDIAHSGQDADLVSHHLKASESSAGDRSGE